MRCAVKIRDEGTVRNKAVYVALGVRPDGSKEILGLWIEQTEGAKFWLRVMNELRNRGVLDMLIAVVDGLKGFPEAINAVFPEAQIQTCIVHLIRHSLAFASWKERRGVKADLPRRQCRARSSAAGRICHRLLGSTLSRHCPGLAAAMGTGRAVLRLSHGGAKNYLHNECDRKSAQPIAQSRACPRALPQR